MWELNTHQTKESLLRAVDSLRQRGGGTKTGRALKHILRSSFKYDMGMRRDARKIVVVFTDGTSSDRVKEPAEHLRDTGIEVYAIGIGGASKLQLVNMATDRAHLYFLKDFSSLRRIVNDFSISLCNSATSRDSVRLVNGTSLCSGRLEVRSNQFNHSNQSNQFNQSNQSNQGWSSVCEADFDLQDAEVVCRELGCGAPWVLWGPLYGEVEAPWWSREFQCGGRESALMDCRSSASHRNTCSPGRAAGLTCSEPLRLVGGASRCAGVLQVKLVEWRMVDGSDWSLKAAAAACTELHCGSAVLTASSNQSSESPGWSVDLQCVEAGWRLRECSKSTQSSSTVEIVCSDLLERPIILVSSVDGVSEAQQQGFRVSWRSSFTLSCSIQPQYPGGSFQLSFTSSSNTTLSRTQPALNHSAHFLFPVTDHAHQGSYTCVYHVHVFSHNFSSESRRLSLVVSDPTVFFIRLTLLLLSLLIFTSLICFSHKTARKYKRSPQEDVEVEQQTRRRRRILQVEQQI
ncbi:lysyl oxidase homolog 2-like [Acanthochromis polyacanthus]|uniref:lysyl oxidase homolog 2-like n=1 Tax=Acanthochromis polyacanthus TaxID=80966 RepID=UPI002234618E|nr:lysyl oxidase homolog 2-like [Acanthochromis polyacanthus]